MSASKSKQTGAYYFTRKFRILTALEFARAQKAGKLIRQQHLSLVVHRNSHNFSRLGLIVSKKVDKRATVRNKIKRRLREIFRNNKDKLPQGFDIIVIARQNTKTLSFAQLKEEFMKAFGGRVKSA